jgi:hypothetical protein
MHNSLSMYVYFYSLHVSGSHVPIIRRINLSIWHLVYVTLYRWMFVVQVWMRLIQTCTLNGHLYRVTYTRCCIDTINSPDDGHMVAQNMWRIEIYLKHTWKGCQVVYLQRLCCQWVGHLLISFIQYGYWSLMFTETVKHEEKYHAKIFICRNVIYK